MIRLILLSCLFRMKMATFACQICHKLFKKRAGMKKHAQQIHCKTKALLYCQYCAKAFTNVSNRNRHQSIVHMGYKKFSCDVCCEIFSQKWLLEGHKRQHHGIGSKSECICGKKFSFHCNFLSHQRICPAIHGENQIRLTCETCGKTYKSKTSLGRHIKYDHLNEAAIICEICGENFTRPSSLTRHKERKH